MFEQFKSFKRFIKLNKLIDEEIILKQSAIGMNSTVGDNLHILMADYDIKNRSKVVESIEEMQKFWNLSDAYIFRTKNGYHVFFWYDIMPYTRVCQIIGYGKFIDPMYVNISKYYSHKTIRVKGKYKIQDIAFEGIVPGCRDPTDEEWEIGELKRKEHAFLIGCKVDAEERRAREVVAKMV
jgi:hypothetical protein